MIDRLDHIIPFAILYMIFCLIMIRLAKSKTRIVIGSNCAGEGNRWKEILILSIIIFISAIKMNFGSDYWAYSVIYNNSLKMYSSVSDVINSRGTILGSGLYVIAFLLKSFTNSIGWNSPFENNLLFFVVSVFTTYVTFRQIKKNSLSFEWSISLYFLLGYFMIANNILKQQVSMSFIMIAYDYLSEKKYLPYVILCFVACIFHSTAVIPAILIPIITSVKINDKVVKIFGGVCVGVMILLPYTIKYFSLLTSLFNQKYVENFSAYGDSNIGRIYVISSLLMYIFIFYFCYRRMPAVLDENKENSSYLSLIALGIFINILSINFWLAIRISLYFYQFSIFVMPNCIEGSGTPIYVQKNIKLIILVFCFMYICFSWDNHYFAFNTIWSDMEPLYLPSYIAQYE